MSSRKVSSKQLAAERGDNAGKRAAKSGGKPNGLAGFGWRRDGRLLFVLPFLLIPQLLGALTGGNAANLMMAALGVANLMIGAVFVRKGLRLERENADSVRQLVDWFPNKAVGCFTFAVGFALVVASTYSTASIAMGILFGAIAAGAVVMRYGLDPKPDRSRQVEMAEAHGLNLKTLVKDLDEAEERVAAIRSAVDKLPGVETKRRVTRVADLASEVLETIEQDPKDVRNARRFMISYLPRAEEIVSQFANDPDLLMKPAMAERFSAVVTELTDVFDDQRKKLTNDESLDLEVKLEVLSQRLRSEGAG